MRKSILKSTAIGMFALLMVFNVTTTVNSLDFSITGLEALASGSSGGGYDCRVEVVYCDIWGTETAQHCIETGDGVDCICGDSTTCD